MKWAVCNANNCHKTATTPMAFVVLRVPRFSAQPPSHFVHYVQELAWQKREKIEKLHNLWHGWSGWKIANKALCIIVHILPHKAFHNQKGLSPGPYATLIAVDDLGAWVCRCGLGWTCSHHTIQTTQATWTISQLTLCPQILHFVFGGPCCGKLLCTYSWFWSPPFLPIPPTEVALFRCQPNSADSSIEPLPDRWSPYVDFDHATAGIPEGRLREHSFIMLQSPKCSSSLWMSLYILLSVLALGNVSLNEMSSFPCA